MNRRQKIIVSVTGIFLVLLILVGLTYAYFLTQIQGNDESKSISVTTAKLELVYGDNSEELIKGNGALMPTIETDVDDAIGTKTFTVTNNGNDSSYLVIIDNVRVTKVSDGSATTFESNDFRYTLSCTKKDNTNCNEVKTLTTFPINGGILISNDIKEEDVHTYTLTLWYIDTGKEQSDDMGKSLQARVNITNSKDTTNGVKNKYMTGITSIDDNNLAYNIINNAKTEKNGTKLLNKPLSNVAESISKYETGKVTYEKISTNSLCAGFGPWYIGDTSSAANMKINSVSSYEEAVGKYVHDECSTWTKYLYSYDSTKSELTFIKEKEMLDEKTLSITTDDLGISYYYRGVVEDNYVNFADMCWRIVRIQGDGSVKLILEDQDQLCDSKDTSGNLNMDGNWSIGSGIFGEINGGDLSYLQPIIYDESWQQPMAKSFYEFQTNKLSKYLDKLQSGNWCLADKKYIQNGSYFNFTYTSLENGYHNPTYFDSYTRLIDGNANGFNPTLKCLGTKLDKFLSVFDFNNKEIIKESLMYVGAITADEIIYAGDTVHTANSNYFLINNYQKNKSSEFMSLSPSYIDGTNDNYVFGVSKYGIEPGFTSSSFRPVVSLAPSTTISKGVGTIGNPYIVE